MIPINPTKFFVIIEKGKSPRKYPNAVEYIDPKPEPGTVDISSRSLLKKEDFLAEKADTYIKIISFLCSQYKLGEKFFEPDVQPSFVERIVLKFAKKDTRPVFSFKTHLILIQEVKPNGTRPKSKPAGSTGLSAVKF